MYTPRLNLEDVVEKAFAESLVEHIAWVQEAGRKIGVPERQLEVHDNSKWSDEEFFGYARHFKGGGAPDEFARAWLHHIHHNPHHWQHWVFADGFTPKGSRVERGMIEMPPNFVLEMIADWLGASRAYTGSWDLKDWLWKNMPKVRVHSNTAEYVRQTLAGLGYADVVRVQRFGHEEAT